MFEAPGGEPSRALSRPVERAAAWAGGELRAWIKGDQTTVALSLVPRDGEISLCQSVSKWYKATFPGARTVAGRGVEKLTVDGRAQDAVITCSPGKVMVIVAPKMGVARSLSG